MKMNRPVEFRKMGRADNGEESPGWRPYKKNAYRTISYMATMEKMCITQFSYKI